MNFQSEMLKYFKYLGEICDVSDNVQKHAYQMVKDGEPVGGINIMGVDPGSDVYLDSIYVHQKHRQKGYMRKMLSALTQAADASKRDIELLVADNDGIGENKMIEVYKSYGFQVTRIDPDLGDETEMRRPHL